jgi:hypothetical protein
MTFFQPQEGAPARTFSRRFTEEVAMALSAIDCVLNGEKAVYASSELTSGQRLNGLLREVGASRSSELRARLGEEQYQVRLWNPNVDAATAFARRLHHTLAGNELVITPAPFNAPEWNQQEYLDFWKALLLTRIKAVYFNDGWQYSNGCTFEFAVALDADIPTYDAAAAPLSRDEGVGLIEEAIRQCERSGIDPRPLADNLKWVRGQLHQALPGENIRTPGSHG